MTKRKEPKDPSEPKRGRGQPRAFIAPERRQLFIDALTAGLPYERACDYARISPRTFYRVKERQEKIQLVAEEQSLLVHQTEEYWLEFVPQKERIEAEFCQDIKKTVAAFVVRSALKVQAAKHNWQSSAWMLERRDYENWGRKDKLIGDPDSPVSSVKIYLPDNGRGPRKAEPIDKPPATTPTPPAIRPNGSGNGHDHP